MTFKNEPFLNFQNPQIASKIQSAVADLERAGLSEYSLIIGGKRVQTGCLMPSLNPNDTAQVLGTFHLAQKEQTLQAISTAKAAFAAWARTSIEDRAALLERLADAMLARRYELLSRRLDKRAKVTMRIFCRTDFERSGFG